MQTDKIIGLLAEKVGMNYYENSDFLLEVAISARAKLIRQRMRQHGKMSWMIDAFKVKLEIDEQDEYCSMLLCPVLKSSKPLPPVIHTSSNLPFVSIHTAKGETLKYISPMELPFFQRDTRFKRYFFVNNYLYITGSLLLKEIQGQALFSKIDTGFSSCLCFKAKTLDNLPDEYVEDLIRLAMCIINATANKQKQDYDREENKP